MVPCPLFNGLRDRSYTTILRAVPELIELLNNCAKSHALLQQDVRDYNRKSGKP